MRIQNIIIYTVSFLVLVACGTTATTATTTTDDNSTASNNKAPDEDYDGVPDDVDQCPYIFGSARTFGCPDADSDGLRDSEDRCPDEKGYANLMGCLDRDYDGIIDPDDQCPDAYGERATGCPDIDPSDVDGDGIVNEQDECPEARGMFTAKGCPDKDGDGLKDELDACPNLFGIGEHNGCPLSIADMMELARLNGHPAKSAGIAEKGYYESYDGKLYDKNDMQINVVSGDIVDQKGTFITSSKNFMIDKGGYIRSMDGGVVRVDEEGYAFGTEGLLSKKQINGDGAGGGIKFEDGGLPKNKGGGLAVGNPDDNKHHTSKHSGTGKVNNDNIYTNPQNEKPLTPQEASDCNRINLATLTAAIYFDYDADNADGSSLRQLNRVVDAMQKCTKLELQVGGHADSDGNDGYNYQLSEKRAKSVLKYIMGQGVSDKRLKYNAYGEKYPLSDNSTEDGKQQNRRAEIHVTKRE
jgi:OOP family OmpA-OmpF porin